MVDDGSTDDLKNFIDDISSDAPFHIRYIYKENGGKHTALNVGIKTIDSELTFIVDSDDMLTPDAVEAILRYHSRYGEDANLCGYSFLRKYPDGTINGNEFPVNEMVTTYIEARINANDTQADKAEVLFTKCLKEFPFPEFPNEKFLGEDLVWIRMALKYSMVHINKAIYIGEYQADGLTNNRRKHNIESPIGCMNRALEFMRPEINRKYQIKGALQYVVYGKFASFSIRELMRKASDKKLVAVASAPGLLLYEKWKRDFFRG